MASEETVQKAPPIRGWLLLPLLLLTLWCAWGLMQMIAYLPTWIGRTILYGPGPGPDHPIVVVPMLVLLGLSFYAWIAFVRRKRYARMAVIVLCSVMLALLGVLLALPPHLVRGGPAIAAAGVLAYFLFSRRVRNTFVR
jgi:hypothetical protein